MPQVARQFMVVQALPALTLKTMKGKDLLGQTSLFEDNAEFGYGIYLAHKTRRENLKNIATKLLADGFYNKHLESWLKTFDDKQNNPDFCRLLQENLSNMLKTCKIEKHKILLEKLAKDADALNKKSIWIIGGDGWAYDIGYGGLDHILASGEDVNILVLDTEVYSNTGGQASKATQTGAVAKFCEDGKKTEKKDLGLMAINYGNVYTASVAIGANMSQCLKAFNEAESYNGVSLIIAYSPCISHGINMSNCMLEERRAVDFGYWNLFRFNPNNIANKFVLDCKQPQGDYLEFLNGETRFKSLAITNPEECEKLFKANEKQAKERFEKYLKLVDFYK